jgi:hypothetical protein
MNRGPQPSRTCVGGFERSDSAPIRIPVSRFEPSPYDEPSCYPGLRPDYSYLFCGDHLRAGLLDVDAELQELGVAGFDERTAVLAYGSNACPSQLARKYDGCHAVFPMTLARAHDLAVVYSDHESAYGAVPATAVLSRGTRTEVFVAWLDPDQLEVQDRSEALNYERRPIDLTSHGLDVAGGRSPARAEIYVSTRGVFTFDGVVPGVAGVATTYRAGPLLTQAEARARWRST